jgi:hypothetical protein
MRMDRWVTHLVRWNNIEIYRARGLTQEVQLVSRAGRI